MKERNNAKEIFLRFKQAAGAKSIIELAQALNVSQQSIYNVQANGKIPGGWFRKIADLNNISIDWLTYGTGAMHRDIAEQPDSAMPNSAIKDPAMPQQSHQAEPLPCLCTHCASFQKELAEERAGWRELVTENRQLWKEIAELRAHTARLEERNIHAPKGGSTDAPNSALNAHFNGQPSE